MSVKTNKRLFIIIIIYYYYMKPFCVPASQWCAQTPLLLPLLYSIQPIAYVDIESATHSSLQQLISGGHINRYSLFFIPASQWWAQSPLLLPLLYSIQPTAYVDIESATHSYLQQLISGGHINRYSLFCIAVQRTYNARTFEN